MLLSALRLFWQLLVLFACCAGLGLVFRFLVPKKFSPLNKVLFSVIGGLFLAVLIPQNLVYLGIPVRISAWIILGAALAQVAAFAHNLFAWTRTLYSNGEIRTLAVVILLTAAFHSVVPIRQGLEWYYGKGYPDQLNYVVLAEFLKEEPYRTSEQETGLRPWLVRSVGFQANAEQLGMRSGPGLELIGLKKERIGQSILTAEMSVWSGTDAKGAYAATVIFFLTVLAISLYVLLRETGTDRFTAGSGALLASLLPAVTRLSLDGFLSQTSVLFCFPFFASLLRPEDLSSRSFTLFFSLTLAYVFAAYSEIAPIGLCTLFLGVLFVRRDKFRTKRLMFMSAILLIILVNPYYLRNLIRFLEQQFYVANTTLLDNLAPNVLTLRGWSELIFGTVINSSFALLFDCCTLLLGLLFLAGAIFLAKRDRLIFGVILLPVILVDLYLATRIPFSSYPIAKIALTVLPVVIGLTFLAPSAVVTNNQGRPVRVLKNLLCAIIVATAGAGSIRYYSEVLQNGGFLRYFRDPDFLNVCRELEEIKNKRIFVFENDHLLTPWICYHARHNDVYFDGGLVSDTPVPLPVPFSKAPDLKEVDFVATRDRIVDLKALNAFCLTLIDHTSGEDRTGGYIRYGLGPPVGLRFLASRPISANLKMGLAPGPGATTFPVHYFLTDEQGQVFQGELWGKNVEVRRMNFPRGLSAVQLSVNAKNNDPDTRQSFPILAELDGIEISDIDSNPGR